MEEVNQKLAKDLEELTIGPKRPRPELRKDTVCPLCGTELMWSHILSRHQKTKKCEVITARVVTGRV